MEINHTDILYTRRTQTNFIINFRHFFVSLRLKIYSIPFVCYSSIYSMRHIYHHRAIRYLVVAYFFSFQRLFLSSLLSRIFVLFFIFSSHVGFLFSSNKIPHIFLILPIFPYCVFYLYFHF